MRSICRSSMLMMILGAISATVIAQESKPQIDCADPNTAPIAVKHMLGPLYRTDPPAEKLGEAYDSLQKLVSGTTNCRLYVQTAGSGFDRSLVNEWIALHHWIDRIANFIYLKSKGRERTDWRLEYADFAEAFEFEA